MLRGFKKMFGLGGPERMKDPSIKREADAEAARKKRENEKTKVKWVRPSEIHRRENQHSTAGKIIRRRGTDATPKSHQVSDRMAEATSEQLEAAMLKIEQSADENKAT